MNIILFGPPGAGKGTQAENLAKFFNLHKISTGDLLREEIKNSTTLGSKINNIINKGQFVSDDIINDLIKKILINKKFHNRLIFDGYPRNLNQAKILNEFFKENNQAISCVLSLSLERELVIKRILGRQICAKCGLIFNEFFYPSTTKNHSCDIKFLKKRSDDSENTIKNRYETYLEKTLPILDFYKEQKLLHEINGNADITQIFEEIRSIIASLQA